MLRMIALFFGSFDGSAMPQNRSKRARERVALALIIPQFIT